MIKSLFAVVLLFICLAGCGQADAIDKGHHVVLISLDGYPAWMWRDPTLPAPNLRKLAKEGACTTAMTVSNPSITWINHTTLITGVTPRRHGVLFNGLLVRQGTDQPPKVEPWVDKSKLVFAPKLYDLAYEAGLTTAEVDWVAVTQPKTIHWSFPELPTADGPIEQEMIAAGLITAEQFGWFHNGPNRKNIAWHDEMWTKAGCHIVARHRPNLLMFHLLNTDAIHHQFGPASQASFSALAYADRLVGDLVKAVEDAGLREQTTFVITTDHGFKKVNKLVYPNVVLRKAGYAEVTGSTIKKCDVAAMTQGGMSFVYVTNPDRKPELIAKLGQLFEETEGVERVLLGSDGPTLGMPTPEENQGMGDLILFAKAGYAFNNGAGGDAAVAPSVGYAGAHGYPADDPELHRIFIASGRGIAKGIVLPRIANLDVAPTIARLLDLKIPNAEGRVIEEILRTK
ncbi:MAG: nucleotide pyrophosphatase/phosphodiesterase family protein [Planctomycetota bacterium]